MTWISFTYDVPPGVVIFEDAFDSSIGSELTVTFGGVSETGTLTEAVVAEDGRSARLTLEITGIPAALLGLVPPGIRHDQT